MSEKENGRRRYQVHGSGAITDALRTIQRQAAREVRGPEMILALRRIARRLQMDPIKLGEPLYRLPALRMQIRTVAIRPVVVDYGVCEDRPLVFLRAVKLLSASKP